MKKEVKNKKSFFRRLIIAAAIISFLSVSFYTVYTIAQSALNKEVTHGKLRDENVILYFEDSQINKGFGLSDGNIVLTTNSLVSFKSDGSVRKNVPYPIKTPLKHCSERSQKNASTFSVFPMQPLDVSL